EPAPPAGGIFHQTWILSTPPHASPFGHRRGIQSKRWNPWPARPDLNPTLPLGGENCRRLGIDTREYLEDVLTLHCPVLQGDAPHVTCHRRPAAAVTARRGGTAARSLVLLKCAS